jgi:hypothetical protein
MCDKPPIYTCNQSQLKRVLCVADMQHCDINTTLYRIGCYKIYSDKLLVMTVNY